MPSVMRHFSRRSYLRQQFSALPLVLAFVAIGLGFYFAPAATAGMIAVGLVGLAMLCCYQEVRLSRGGQSAAGEIVDHRREEDCFFPVVEFSDASGNVRRETTRAGRGTPTPAVGSRVAVLYDPAGKLGCEIDTFWSRSGVTVVLLLMALVFALGAVLGR